MSGSVALPLRPLDDAARDGCCHLLSNGRTMASARWTGEGWEYASGAPLGFVPVAYYQQGGAA